MLASARLIGLPSYSAAAPGCTGISFSGQHEARAAMPLRNVFTLSMATYTDPKNYDSDPPTYTGTPRASLIEAIRSDDPASPPPGYLAVARA